MTYKITGKMEKHLLQLNIGSYVPRSGKLFYEDKFIFSKSYSKIIKSQI